MKKIGIMGGTFDPIHIGHLMMAEEALRQFELDEVLFMPSKNPPHKKKQKLASEVERSSMIKLAIQPFNQFVYSDFELKRTGTTYTSDTLLELTKVNKDSHYYFILGTDSLVDIETWHRPDIVLAHSTILVCNRGTMKVKDLTTLIEKLNKKYQADIRMVDMATIEAASRTIRKRISNHERYNALCPHDVAQYIYVHSLYLPEDEKNTVSSYEIQELIMREVKAEVKKKRYQHTIGVVETAVCLAIVYGEDITKTKLAASLHDIAKHKTCEEMVALCESDNINVTEFERKYPFLLHGKAGSVIAKLRFGIMDNDILNAIRYHTTGRPDMTLIEKIIFIADYIEPGRNMDSQPHPLSEVRKMAFQQIDQAICMCLEDIIEYLTQTQQEIDEASLRTYDYYKKK